MSINELLAVLWEQFVLHDGACVAQVVHKLAGAADDLVAALSQDRHFLDGRDQSELFIALMLLLKSLDILVVVLNVAQLEDCQDRFGVRIGHIAPDGQLFRLGSCIGLILAQVSSHCQ